ncbi:MAG: purine-nucleoside phosphorylase [Elusimicrobia bacterium]|nr:purine-nucleoside phosphorylase [Elusimicrobiota bacterium]
MTPAEILEFSKRGADFLRAKGVAPRAALVLGSGLGGSIPDLTDTVEVAYTDVPGFPKPTVVGHSGKLLFGTFKGKKGPLPVAVMQGRFHHYEGHPMGQITLPVRVLANLGVKTLVLTSAVGSMDKKLPPGSVCVVSDHINFMGANPLRGCHTPGFGGMFPDLSGTYTPALRKLALAEAKRLKLPAREGVYVACHGPSYETPAEIRAYSKLGGSIVGMSVVPEAIVARQCGLDLLVLSWISNMAAGIIKETLTHHDVLALGQRMAGRLKGLATGILERL